MSNGYNTLRSPCEATLALIFNAGVLSSEYRIKTSFDPPLVIMRTLLHGRQKRKDKQHSSSSRLAITQLDPLECALLPLLERELEASMSTIRGGRENQKIIHGNFCVDRGRLAYVVSLSWTVGLPDGRLLTSRRR